MSQLTIVLLAYLPALPIALVAVPLWVHLFLFFKHQGGSSFGHITWWGFHMGVGVLLLGLLWVTGVVLPSVLGARMASLGGSIWPWILLAVTTVIAALCAYAYHRLGRCLFINGETGAIRYYNLVRPVPKAPGTHLDFVDLLAWDGEELDVWGLATLRPRVLHTSTVGGATSHSASGDIPKECIQGMMGRVNHFLVEQRLRRHPEGGERP